MYGSLRFSSRGSICGIHGFSHGFCFGVLCDTWRAVVSLALYECLCTSCPMLVVSVSVLLSSPLLCDL
jgi:hypothetical protein